MQAAPSSYRNLCGLRRFDVNSMTAVGDAFMVFLFLQESAAFFNKLGRKNKKWTSLVYFDNLI